MRCLACENKVAPLAVKVCPPIDKLLNQTGAVFHHHSDCFGVTESRSRSQSILEVQLDLVIVRQRDSNTALCIFGV